MNKNDFKIRVTRGTGPGGQHKNKVETCVIITHMPTGLQEKCQDTRSKSKNIKITKKRLLQKIEKYERDKIHEARNKKRIKLIQNQKTVRTYNYVRNEVYDHNTKVKHNLRKFIKGEIDLV